MSPPGFSRGLAFAEDGRSLIKESVDAHRVPVGTTINLLELIHQEEEVLRAFEQEETETDQEETAPSTELLPEEQEVLPKEVQVLNISAQPPPALLGGGSEWAIPLDPNEKLTDFEKKVPDMAKKFPFELDNFQKLAIMQLEQHNHVFVAAHTSAGKCIRLYGDSKVSSPTNRNTFVSTEF